MSIAVNQPSKTILCSYVVEMLFVRIHIPHEHRQFDLFQVSDRSQSIHVQIADLAHVQLVKINFVAIYQYLHCSVKIHLIFAETASPAGICSPSFHPTAIVPTLTFRPVIVIVIDIYIYIYIDIEHRH